MDMLASAQAFLAAYAQSVGLLIVAAIVLPMAALFVAAPFSWRAKGVFLLVLANEVRGAAIAAPIALALFR